MKLLHVSHLKTTLDQAACRQLLVREDIAFFNSISVRIQFVWPPEHDTERCVELSPWCQSIQYGLMQVYYSLPQAPTVMENVHQVPLVAPLKLRMPFCRLHRSSDLASLATAADLNRSFSPRSSRWHTAWRLRSLKTLQ